MKLYNHELEPFIEFLYKLKLSGKSSRMRVRFINLLTEKYKLFKEEHMQLIKEHSNLDENGNPKIVEANGVKQFDVKDLVSFNKDYTELLNEEVVIEESESNKEMLLSVKESVLNCNQEFEGESAIQHDRWCEIMEQICYENDK